MSISNVNPDEPIWAAHYNQVVNAVNTGDRVIFQAVSAPGEFRWDEAGIQSRICQISLDARQLLAGTVSVMAGSQPPVSVSAGQKDWGMLLTANEGLNLTAAADPAAAAFSPMLLAPDVYVNRIPPAFHLAVSDWSNGHFYNEARTIRWQLSIGGLEIPSYIQQYEYIENSWTLTKSFNLGTVMISGFFVRPDGLMCFVVLPPQGFYTETRIQRYITSTAWDADELDYSNQHFAPLTTESYSNLQFDTTGFNMFWIASSDFLNPTARIICYELDSAWNPAAGVVNPWSPPVFNVLNSGLELTPDFVLLDGGTGLASLSDSENNVSTYHRLDTAWDLTSVQPAMQVALTSISPEASTDARCVRWQPDGMRFFVLSAGAIRQYDVDNAWELGGASLSGSLSIPNTLYFDFNVDGSKLYTMLNSRVIAQQNVSPAWDISDAGLPSVSTLNLSAEITETDLLALSIFDDTRFFVLAGGSQAELRQYSMSGGDITTGSHVETLDISAETSQARAMHMASEKLLLLQAIGSLACRILPYTAPGNALETAAYTGQQLDLLWGESTRDIRFSHDGHVMYVLCAERLHRIEIPDFTGQALISVLCPRASAMAE